MEFRTILPDRPSDWLIDHTDAMTLLGSCFTEHFEQRLADRKFRVYGNPFGIVYNPLSIGEGLERLLEGNQLFQAEELTEYEGLWHSRMHHGAFSHPDPVEALEAINRKYLHAARHLSESSVLFITLGTAEIFRRLDTGVVVANNHKMPERWFEKSRLSVSDATDALLPALQRWALAAPERKVVLTVSPVRHLRSGLVENQRSKATLLLACAAICDALPQAVYFPAYELLMDDLRDYRFYADDLLHPAAQAVEYIWLYFSRHFFSEETRDLIHTFEKLRRAAGHRPLHPERAQHRLFLQQQLEITRVLAKKYPHLDFSLEMRAFSA
jgi:hypothetical protein